MNINKAASHRGGHDDGDAAATRPSFKELKHNLSIRPVHHRLELRIEAHIFDAFLAYCLQVTPEAS